MCKCWRGSIWWIRSCISYYGWCLCLVSVVKIIVGMVFMDWSIRGRSRVVEYIFGR